MTTPMGSVEQETPHSCDLDSSIQSKADTGRSHDELDVLDDEAPLKSSSKYTKSSVKSKLVDLLIGWVWEADWGVVKKLTGCGQVVDWVWLRVFVVYRAMEH